MSLATLLCVLCFRLVVGATSFIYNHRTLKVSFTLFDRSSNSHFSLAKTINVTSTNDPGSASEEFLELANGCLCCSIKDSGVAAIEKLMQRKGAFDYILLETTGLADPGA